MDVFHALADPTRRSIVEVLAAERKLSASAIGKRFPMSAAAISQHLKILREAQLVHVEKDGQRRLYELNPGTISDLEAWASRMKPVWNRRLDALDTVLQAEKRNAKGDSHGQ